MKFLCSRFKSSENKASHAKDRLRQEVADKERAVQEDRLRGFQETDSVKSIHGFYVDEISRNTINSLMYKVRELHCEILCPHHGTIQTQE